jgi:HemX protein
MDRLFVVLSTFCFFAATVRTIVTLRAGLLHRGHVNLIAVAAGFSFQTAFLSVRGHSIHRCPITNLFEVFIFLAWSVAFVYLAIGAAYRLSLMGGFTAPLIFLIQFFALLAPIDRAHRTTMPVNPWLEMHASISIVALGAFALACIAGVMYLVQERQLKTRQLHSIFYHLPPLTDLFAAITRLIWMGFVLYSVGLVSGFFTGEPLPQVKMIWAIGVWIFYAAILQARHLRRLAPKRIAALCVVAFSVAVSVLWGITFVSQKYPT